MKGKKFTRVSLILMLGGLMLTAACDNDDSSVPEPSSAGSGSGTSGYTTIVKVTGSAAFEDAVYDCWGTGSYTLSAKISGDNNTYSKTKTQTISANNNLNFSKTYDGFSEAGDYTIYITINNGTSIKAYTYTVTSYSIDNDQVRTITITINDNAVSC